MFCKKITLLLLLTVPFGLQAQVPEFGEVSKEELLEKSNPMDTSSVATYLFKYRKTFFEYDQISGFKLVTEIHERLKIYTKEGFDYATKKVNLYKQGSDSEKLLALKAITYNLVDDKIEETKLRKEGEFKVELSRYHDQKSFAMPNVKEGSVIEYKYRINSPFITNVDEFIFQHDIPAKRILASMESPEYFNFRVNTKGFLPVIPKTEKRFGKINFQNKKRSGGNHLGNRTINTTYSSSSIDYKKDISLYDLSDIPALKEEPFVNNINNYRSAVKYELSHTKFPNSSITYYSTTWEDVVKKIYEHPNFGDELNKKGYYEKDLEAIISGINNPEKRALLIFDYVKSQVKWNGNYGKYTDDGVRAAYKEHAGNVAEINLMLTSMLRYAKLNANPILVSTRQNGIPLFPTREGYNYVISGVELNGRTVLLDATSTFSRSNILPLRALNWEGRLILENGTSTTIGLTPTERAGDMIMMNISMNDDGSINGKLRQQYRKHNALLFRKKYHKGGEASFLEKEENENGDIEISDYQLKNISDLSKPIVQSYDFFKEDAVEAVADKLYFSPFFQLRTTENPFKLKKREYPIDFGFPYEDKYVINIAIPKGYQVESLPESKIIRLPDDLGQFIYAIDSTDEVINLKAELALNSAIVPVRYYEALKEFYRQLVEKETEKVVLSKPSLNEPTERTAKGR